MRRLPRAFGSPTIVCLSPQRHIYKPQAIHPPTIFLRLTRPLITISQMRKVEKEKICIVGSGNWGSAIARIAGQRHFLVLDVHLAKTYPNSNQHKEEPRHFCTYCHPTTPPRSGCPPLTHVFLGRGCDDVQGRPLSTLVNETHENPKYLPGINLGTNVVAEPNLLKAIEDATALVFFLPGVLKAMSGHVSPTARAGVQVEGSKIATFPSVISSVLGIPCSALSGANIANEVAEDKFCESTLGVPPAPMTTPPDEDAQLHAFSESHLWHHLFQTSTFRIRVVQDVEGVCLCGGLKTDVIALAAGFSDGLGWGSNSKAAIMRIGLLELKDFCLEFFPSTRAPTFLEESCGVADIMTSCACVDPKPTPQVGFRELEEEKLNGQKLQGPQTAEELHTFLTARGDTVRRPGGYPLFEAVWRICYEGMSPEKLIDSL
ncbi:Glycerol-3-phosphate dehydrogenase (NAD+) [Ceratobasidium theobromae]|uniref:Glycerol-3-phosphate dehydrogenase [NAD(+)] n=1 Tax=Ceratobasidium theobromae TaxID=1582974 RepID=A0A5N5QHU5_9AGAM|nr:Glycerol-3-phosphate dehydrogenase (NAD+) [Ceratobasidium theobromae]